jgi:mannonate dehydratase
MTPGPDPNPGRGFEPEEVEMRTLGRREFAKTGAAAMAAAGLPVSLAASTGTAGPGIKISIQVGGNPSDEDLQFVKQLGVDYVNINTGGADATLENFARLKTRVETAGLKVWNIGNSNVHNMEEVTLNLPGRDRKIEEYKQYLHNLAKTGVFYTTYAHMGNGIWSTPSQKSRGGAPARAFDLSNAEKGNWAGKEFTGPLTHGRKYSADEIWSNFEYFIKQVKPVAESLKIRIGIHPDDPPVPELGGVPRCIFGSFDGYKRALEIANSPYIGMCLCIGCWLEGGKQMGKDPVETIRYFGRQGKIFKVHFRNVSAPLPQFVETLMDEGYARMYPIMRALREVRFDGVVIADHIPQLLGGPRVGTAYSIAYMRALIERASDEVRS